MHSSLRASPRRLFSSSYTVSVGRKSIADIAAPAALTTKNRRLPRQASVASLPPSSQHDSLESFLAYAQDTKLSTSSTTYVGTYYEYLCALSLRRLGFNLTRTGGRADAGIDLLGSWQLPDSSHPLRCIVQCKKLKAKAGPNLVRELEGAFAGTPAGWRGGDVVGVLCAGREATKGVREAIRNARRGLVWCQIEDMGEGVGRVRQMLWNQRVGALGAEGVSVGVRHTLVAGDVGERGCHDEVVLMWKGEVWKPNE
ncbi:hypothetical protein MMC26_001577 [Xylographa opegraphella]|nr:hypothetical protein [Xylographa opegraphella]